MRECLLSTPRAIRTRRMRPSNDHTSVRLDELYLHGMLWPFLLCATLLCGITAAIACLKYEQITTLRQSVEAPAVAEAIIAVCSGALLWIGWWDFLDVYLVPNSWWSKLCMLFVGAIGAVATRSLYAVPSPPSAHSAEGTSAAIDDDEEECIRASREQSALPGAFSPHSRAIGARLGDEAAGRRAARTSASASTAGAVRSRLARARAAAARSRWCCLKPPKLSGMRCARALLATFSGLTMWVGLWDLLDVHVLPTLFTACKHEPTTGCAFVKLGLVAIGAIGLYLTRSLYGEEGITVVQFQRL